MRTFINDLRFAMRMLANRPGFALVAILTLALGIGANTAMFSAVNAVLLRPLPFDDPARLVDVWMNNPKHGVVQGVTSYPEFLDWKKQSTVFASMAAYRETQGVVLTGVGEPAKLHGAIVSPDFFNVLRATAAVGSTFGAEHDIAGKANVVVLSQELWQARFQSDPHVLGKLVTIEGKPYNVIGVMRRGFQFPILAEPIDVWIPLSAYDGSMPAHRGNHIYAVFARLRPGISFSEASSQINVIENRLASEYPDNHTPGDGANVSPLLPDLVSGSRDALLILFGAVAIVLLIACANVANLLLIRASGRAREFAIRRALGAGRARLIRQLLSESALLATAAGALGLLLGWWIVSAFVTIGPRDIPRLATLHLDARVFAFTIAVSLFTTILFGFAPALRSSQTDIGDSLKERSGATTGKRHRLLDGLVAAEVALSLVMIAAAGLLLRTLWHFESTSPGFDPHQVLTFSTDLPAEYTDAKTAAFYNALLSRLRGLPDAGHVSAVFPLPFSGTGIDTGFDIEGRPSDPAAPIDANLSSASRGYFATMHIPLLRGRDFQDADGIPGKAVAIVNQAFANQYFPHEDPLGKRIRPDARTSGTPAQMSEIVAIVGDIKLGNLREEPQPIVFVPIPELPLGALKVVIRSEQSPGGLLSVIREQVHSIEPGAVVFRGKTLDQYLSVTLGQPRFNALLLTAFASLAVLLAIVGVYGAVAYVVNERTHEIGVRMALGAHANDVVSMMLSHGAKLIGIGLIVGFAGALAATRLMSSLLFGVGASDPGTFAFAGTSLAVMALAACWIPARRASRVDPMVALRYE